jgi:2'-5' RNA ligase
MTTRLLWAAELPATLRARLVTTQRALQSACKDAPVQWAREEQLHLTLKFLGEVQDVDAVVAAVREGVNPPGALQLEVAGLGTFGKKTLWAGVGGPGRSALVEVVAAIDDSLEPLGFEREQGAYSPQVTLGRARGGRRPGRGVSALQPALAANELKPLPFVLEELVLLQSVPKQGPGPAAYAPLERVSLLA